MWLNWSQITSPRAKRNLKPVIKIARIISQVQVGYTINIGSYLVSSSKAKKKWRYLLAPPKNQPLYEGKPWEKKKTPNGLKMVMVSNTSCCITLVFLSVYRSQSLFYSTRASHEHVGILSLGAQVEDRRARHPIWCSDVTNKGWDRWCGSKCWVIFRLIFFSWAPGRIWEFATNNVFESRGTFCCSVHYGHRWCLYCPRPNVSITVLMCTNDAHAKWPYKQDGVVTVAQCIAICQSLYNQTTT